MLTRLCIVQQRRADLWRPSVYDVDATIQSVSLVLCNDRPRTYGAPDILQVSLDRITARFSCTCLFRDRPPNQVFPRSFLLAIKHKLLSEVDPSLLGLCGGSAEQMWHAGFADFDAHMGIVLE